MKKILLSLFLPVIMLIILFGAEGRGLANGKQEYWIDTDIGGDIDDALTLSYISQTSAQLCGVSTLHTNPIQKGSIARLILNELGKGGVPVYTGIGYSSSEDRQIFFDQNPMWPKQVFGVPHPQKGGRSIYSNQGKAYEDVYGVSCFNELIAQLEERPPWDAMAEAAEACEGKLNIIAIGPTHNVAAFLEKYPHLSGKVKLWVMGGWFEKNGQVVRPGYNTGINLAASDRIFNSGAEITLINSQFIEDNRFGISERDFEVLKLAEHKTKLASALWQDWLNWNRGDAFKKKNIADPVTAFLAVNEQEITDTMPVKIGFPVDSTGQLTPDVIGLNILSPDAHKLIQVQPADESNVHVITGVKDCGKIYTGVMAKTLKCFYPQASEELILQVLGDQEMDSKIAAQSLNQACERIQSKY